EFRTAGFAVALGACLIIALPFLIPYLGRPLLSAYMSVFVIVVAATLLRIGVDSYNYVLVALHHDRAIAIISLVAVPLSAALYAVLIPLFRLQGASIAYLLTGALLIIPRIVFSRRSTQMVGGGLTQSSG